MENRAHTDMFSGWPVAERQPLVGEVMPPERIKNDVEEVVRGVLSDSFDAMYERTQGGSGVLGYVGYEKALQNPDTFAAIRDSSATLARLPLRVFYRDDEGKRRQVRNTPEVRLLDRPGGSWTRQLFWQFIERSMETHGRGMAIIVKDQGGRIIALQPVSPDGWTIDMVTDPATGGLVFTYRSPGHVTYPYDEILDFPFDLHVGRSNTYKPIAPLRYASRLQDLFARGEEKINSIYSFAAVIFVKMLNSSMANEEESYKERIASLAITLRQAARKGFGIVPVDEGSEIDSSAVSTADQNQLVELMGQISVQASKFFGTSPVLHGDARGSYRNAEGAMLAFARLKVSPITNVCEQEIGLKLLPPDQYAEFDLNAMLKGDVARETQRQVMLVTAGIRTPNQAADELGYEASDDETADDLKDGTSMGGANLMPSMEPPDDEPTGQQDG